MFAISLPALAVSLLFTSLLRPLSSQIDHLVSATSKPAVLLVTAHPDDECLFFTPTILSIQEKYPKSDLYSLCLSVGDADGLGAIREKELRGSLDILGIPKGKRWVLDHPDLRDNITAFWDVQTVAGVIRPYVLEHSITSILTFDSRGISSHPNHASLPAGVTHLISTFPSDAKVPPPHLFTLVTVPLVHKYVGLVSPLLAKMAIHTGSWLENFIPVPSEQPRISVAVSGATGYLTALRAMQQHKSQLVWFRWLNVAFSRYMWVNDWVEVFPPS